MIVSSLIPPGHLELGDAFQQALEALENVSALRLGTEPELTDEDDLDFFVYDAKVRKVERQMRNALADRKICSRVRDPVNGLATELADCEKWRA
jgi:hypothetical protein